MSRQIVESADRALALHVRPAGLSALIGALRQLPVSPRITKQTYIVREQALLVEFHSPADAASAVARFSAVLKQPFVKYPIFWRDIWTPTGHVDPSQSAEGSPVDPVAEAIQLRRSLQLDIVPDFSWPAFRKHLLHERSISGQILAYYNHRLLGKSHVMLRSLLATGINSLLSSVSAGTGLKIVGSLRTGTSFDKSDCDMNLGFYTKCCVDLCTGDFAPTHAAVSQRFVSCLNAFRGIRIESLKKIPLNFSSPDHPNRVFLAHLGLLLREIDPQVADLQCHTSARVPVIRARHEFLNFYFDVSLDLGIAHRFNYLINGLTSSCPPFTPLLIIIKGLCKESRLCLIHQEDFSGHLTTFKLTALLIYFLQGCSYLPPMSQLLHYCQPGAPPYMYANFPSAEGQRMKDAFASNPRNLELLLKQFLGFLVRYPFDQTAIDLLNYAEVPRSQLPQELQSDFMVVLNPTSARLMNVTTNIKASEWKQHCAVFTRVIDHLESAEGSTPQASDSWGLVGLFDFPETDLPDPDSQRLQKIVESSARTAATSM